MGLYAPTKETKAQNWWDPLCPIKINVMGELASFDNIMMLKNGKPCAGNQIVPLPRHQFKGRVYFQRKSFDEKTGKLYTKIYNFRSGQITFRSL